MNTTIDNSDTVLRINRIFNAPRERVFDAWTKPEMISQWMGCNESKVENADIDARVGGKMSITMVTNTPGEDNACGGTNTLESTFREVTPPERLVFTWIWRGEANWDKFGETLVTVDFKDLGNDRTELRLTHEGFSNSELTGLHNTGWDQSFAKLAKALDACAQS